MSKISTKPSIPATFTPPLVVPLEDGEQMLVDEFIRRWEALPVEWQKAHKRIELIEGVVRMSPPNSGGFHAEPHFNFFGFLTPYA
ncbi:MAG: hypothetical protein EXR98_13625 [Gemmataceae bacterium]|nr:hypothetical protein [Gemmataceae bacterium]